MWWKELVERQVRNMRLAGYAARMGEMRNESRFWPENLNGRDHAEEIGIDRKIILEWILREYGGKVWTGCISFKIGTSGGLL
jgi:hypothetical protein